MKNSITPREVGALTMVCTLAENKLSTMFDDDVRKSMYVDLEAVRKLTRELEWDTKTKDDELKWLEADFQPISVTHHGKENA